MELGSHSPYYSFFDINWLSEDKRFFGKLMKPSLGEPLQDALQQQEIQLAFGENGFHFAYYDNKFPMRAASYYPLLQQQSDFVKSRQPGEDVLQAYAQVLDILKPWSQENINSEQIVQWPQLRAEVVSLYEKSEAVRQAVQQALESANQDWHTLKQLLSEQNFELTYWKTTETKISYRRFFTVNDLISLNMQEPEVFHEYHYYIKKLVDEGWVQGLRVDHVDGLFDPSRYLEHLRTLAGEDIYLVVEKILEAEEEMPANWPIQGTTGYEFLGNVSQLFTNSQGKEKFTQLYDTILPGQPDYHDIVYDSKMFMLMNRMKGELINLMRLMKRLDIIPYPETVEEDKLRRALAALLSAFPVYRIYSNEYPFSGEAMEVIGKAFILAESKEPSLDAYFERLREIFNGVADRDEKQNKNRLHFVMRCQQYTGPLAAKGVEDTTFYAYNRLISHNEVGDTPGIFGITPENFHQRMSSRLPHSLNATATHDTKRGEDARLRINVLSEIPGEWEKVYRQWKQTNQAFITKLSDNSSPDDNDEYFIYQTLVGTYPVHGSPAEEDYQQRLTDYMGKAIKEAKRNTSWSSPDDSYEEGVASFVAQMLSHRPFIDMMEPFVGAVARTGAVYSLGQTLLKITAPGIPDIYQGTEHWDLSMVDPDNRRPVDYEERTNTLQTLTQQFEENPEALVSRLCQDLSDPAIKFFTLYRALQTRRAWEDFFLDAGYQPVAVEGVQAAHVLAFRRTQGKRQTLTVVPLYIRGLTLQDDLPVGEGCWQDTRLHLDDTAGTWTNVLTQEMLPAGNQMLVSQVLKKFPVALLTQFEQ